MSVFCIRLMLLDLQAFREAKINICCGPSLSWLDIYPLPYTYPLLTICLFISFIVSYSL